MVIKGKPISVQLMPHSRPACKVVNCDNQCIHRVPSNIAGGFMKCGLQGYDNRPTIVLHENTVLCTDYTEVEK